MGTPIERVFAFVVWAASLRATKANVKHVAVALTILVAIVERIADPATIGIFTKALAGFAFGIRAVAVGNFSRLRGRPGRTFEARTFTSSNR